ncbi:MAG: thiol reductase thioredoxin [Mollicutes bacterium]|nr:thiol reductase thioredoxin [Mollicutes bacterium]
MVKHLEKEEDFYKLIEKGIVLVDFYADWCGPCKMLIPVLNEVDFCDVIKVNIDEYPNLAQKFGIMSIPTLAFFKDGLESERLIGFRGINDLKETYESIQ